MEGQGGPSKEAWGSRSPGCWEGLCVLSQRALQRIPVGFTAPTPSTLHQKGPAEAPCPYQRAGWEEVSPWGSEEQRGLEVLGGLAGLGEWSREEGLRGSPVPVAGGGVSTSQNILRESRGLAPEPADQGELAIGLRGECTSLSPPPLARMGFPSGKGSDQPPMSRGGL